MTRQTQSDCKEGGTIRQQTLSSIHIGHQRSWIMMAEKGQRTNPLLVLSGSGQHWDMSNGSFLGMICGKPENKQSDWSPNEIGVRDTGHLHRFPTVESRCQQQGLSTDERQSQAPEGWISVLSLLVTSTVGTQCDCKSQRRIHENIMSLIPFRLPMVSTNMLGLHQAFNSQAVTRWRYTNITDQSLFLSRCSLSHS